MDEFLVSIAEVFEVPSVREETCFRDLPMWDSLTGFAVIVLIRQKYKIEIAPQDLKAANTVKDLAKLARINVA